MAKLPHIVILNPDQWRWDVMGHMGNPAAVTPNLDQSVRTDSVSFRYAFSQGTVCTPSRCSFMSGWYPHTAGHRTMFHMLRRHEPVLLKRLKDAGYFVWWSGGNDTVPAQNGFDAYCDVKYRAGKDVVPNLHNIEDRWRGKKGDDGWYSQYAGKLTPPPGLDRYIDSDWDEVQAAVDLIRKAPKDKPLCIFISLEYPHPPYGVEEPYFSLIDRSKLPPRVKGPSDWSLKPSMMRGIRKNQDLQKWPEENWTELRATYYGMCARVDTQYGMIVEALKQAGIHDDTAMFTFADHGDYTGDFGIAGKNQNTFEDCLCRVPLVIKPPSWAPVRPRVSDAIVELIDFPATVEALTGVATTHTHFGRSLLDVVAGKTDEHRDAAFCEGGRLHGEMHCSEAEALEYLSSDSIYWPVLALQAKDGPEHTKAAMCRTRDFKYVRRFYESDELYDLRRDPGETDNRIGDPSLAGVLAALKERMLKWYMETCDVVPHEPDARW